MVSSRGGARTPALHIYGPLTFSQWVEDTDWFGATAILSVFVAYHVASAASNRVEYLHSERFE